jgi:hypothetical protein
MIECSFLIPLCGDRALSDGTEHLPQTWEWLEHELFDRFEGQTIAPGEYEGAYRDPQTGARVADRSRKYLVALPAERLDEIRDVLSGACVLFRQKCIYLSVAGHVEFIEPPATRTE